MSQTDLLQGLPSYQPSPEAARLLDTTSTVLLVGVTAAGKDTILRELRHLADYHFLISHTTRAPRPNDGVMEREGVEYHFIDNSTARHLLEEKAFIEANIFSGNLYGTSIAELREAHNQGKIAITDVEVKGVDDYMQLSANVHPIFILPPSYAVWQTRFLKRYGDHAEDYAADITRRLTENKAELEFALSKPYFTFVVNDQLDACVAEVDQLAHGAKQNLERQQEGRQVAAAILAELDAQYPGTLDD